jgi:hypothetical protein
MLPTVMRAQRDLWRDVQSSSRAARSRRLGMSVIRPLAAPLSKDGESAINAFVDFLISKCPDLYSEQVLRRRWQNGCATVLAVAAAGAVLEALAPPDPSIIGDAALVLLLFAGWSLITTIQLWRTHRLVERARQSRQQG